FSFERYRGASATVLKAKVAAVEIVSPGRVRFRLKQPWPDFMTFFGTPATGAAWIVPKKYVERVGDEGYKRAPIGAGPYRLVAINTAGYLGLGRISSSFIPHSLEYYWDPPRYAHDPKRSRQLLAEAGYPSGFDAGELSSEPFAGSGIGEPVVNDLTAVGIKIRLRLLERAAFLKQFGEKTLKH